MVIVFLILALCHVIKNSMSVTSLNFTGCGLSAKAAEVLAETIKVLYSSVNVGKFFLLL